MSSPPRVSVCVCTYRRPAMLRELLQALQRQRTDGRFTIDIVVADNDRNESARSAVEQQQREAPLPIRYVVEPRQNIARVRNLALARAGGDFIAFIDDDEVPPDGWLLTAWSACLRLEVDGVLAPVLPRFEQRPPRWLLRGGFCERPDYPTGRALHWRETRTGNVLLKRSLLQGLDEPFRPRFGNGGEDQDFFRRLMARGARFAWCSEAFVHERVPPERCRRGYLLRRALLRGQNEVKLSGRRGLLKSLVAVPAYALLLPFVLPVQSLFMRVLVRLCDHAGKLAAVLGYRPLGDKYIGG